MNYFKLYWGVVILLLPLWIRVEKIPLDMRFSKDMFFVFSVFMSVLLFNNKKIKPKCFIAILAYLLIISTANQYFIVSNAVIFQWLWVSSGLICFSQFYGNINFKDKNFYLNIISMSAIVQSIWVVSDTLGVEVYRHILNLFTETRKVNASYTGGASLAIGSLGNSMVCSTFLAITGASLFRKHWVFSLPLVLYAIYLTQSATGMISIAVGIIAYFVFKIFKEKGVALSFMSLLFAGIATLVYFERDKISFLNDNGRLQVWKEAITMIDGIDIIYGKGLGYIHDNFSREFPHSEVFRHLHNEYLEIFLAYGIIGIVIFGIILFTMLNRENNITIISMVFVYLTTMFSGLTIHISPTALIGILLMALCLIEENKKNGTNHSSTRPQFNKPWRSKIKNN